MARHHKRVCLGLCASLTALGAGCLTPNGYSRDPDAGASAIGGAPPGGSSGGAPVGQSGQGGQAGNSGSSGAGGIGATGGNTATGGGAGGGAGRAGSGGGSGGGAVPGAGGTSATGSGGSPPPPPPPGMPLYSDDFESDAVGAAMAKGWIQDTIDSDTTKGTFGVISDNGNHVLQGAATGSDFIMDIGGDATWTDYTFQVDVKMMTGSSFEFGVFGRFAEGSDKGNYYEAYMDDSGEVQLRARLDGSTASLGTKSKSTTGDAQLNTVYTFTLDMHGSVITVSVNGVARVSMVMDTTLTTGGIGLIVNGGTAEFDNVYVTE